MVSSRGCRAPRGNNIESPRPDYVRGRRAAGASTAEELVPPGSRQRMKGSRSVEVSASSPRRRQVQYSTQHIAAKQITPNGTFATCQFQNILPSTKACQTPSTKPAKKLASHPAKLNFQPGRHRIPLGSTTFNFDGKTGVLRSTSFSQEGGLNLNGIT